MDGYGGGNGETNTGRDMDLGNKCIDYLFISLPSARPCPCYAMRGCVHKCLCDMQIQTQLPCFGDRAERKHWRTVADRPICRARLAQQRIGGLTVLHHRQRDIYWWSAGNIAGVLCEAGPVCGKWDRVREGNRRIAWQVTAETELTDKVWFPPAVRFSLLAERIRIRTREPSVNHAEAVIIVRANKGSDKDNGSGRVDCCIF